MTIQQMPNTMKNYYMKLLTCLAFSVGLASAAEPINGAEPSANACSITVAGQQVTLQSPAFAFTLDTADGLRAISW